MNQMSENVGMAQQSQPQAPIMPQMGYSQAVSSNAPAGVNYPPQPNVASLYVGELRSDVTEQILWSMFSHHGQVVSVKVCRDSQTQASLGYAYVNFRTHQEAEKAMELMNFMHIEGKPCRVMWSMRDATKRKFGAGNLFIKNIDPSLDAKSLYQAFSSFGAVLSCKIALDEYGNSKGYGFIQFYNEMDAMKAKERSDGIKFSKKRLVVTKFIPKSERKDAKPFNPDEYTNIFVKNFTKEWTDMVLRKRFEKFGNITSCVVQKNDKGESLCYGFVNFSKHDSAVRAISEMNESALDNGNKITVCRAMKKLERQSYLRRQYEERKREIFRKFQNMNLYVKNFDETVTDDKFKSLFEEFGDIKSAHVMKDENNRSRCFGFVCFSKPEEADRALTAMNSKMFDGKPLYVSHAQSKEDRRKQFEQQTYNNSFRGPMMAPQGMQFVYPPAAAFPYPTQGQFTRYPNSGPRMQNRGLQHGVPQPGQQFMPQNVRPQFFNQSNPNYQQNSYRPRNSQVGVRAQPGQYQRHQNNQPQVSVNSVTVNPVNSANDAPVKTKDHKPIQKAPLQDSKTEFKDKIFKLVQNVFAQREFNSEHVSRVTGLVIDYFSSHSNAHSQTDDKDICLAIEHAYGSVMEERGKLQE